MLKENLIEKYSQELLNAEDNQTPIDPLTEREDLGIKDAYSIQHVVRKMKKERGEVVVGKKIGLTNDRIQDAFDIDRPDFGQIMDALIIEEGEPIRLSELIQPKIEVELGFVLDEDLKGPGVTTPEVIRATKGVIPTFEVIDSRVEDWNIEIEDTIADNASCGRVIPGSTMTGIEGLNLSTIGVVLRKNGEVIETAAGASVLGNPAKSVAWLANKLAEFDEELNEGELILSGSMISPIEIGEGDVIQAEFGSYIGSLTAFIRE